MHNTYTPEIVSAECGATTLSRWKKATAEQYKHKIHSIGLVLPLL